MKKHIFTLVRITDDPEGAGIYTSRSFSKFDDKAIETIRGCIEEDQDDGETPKELVQDSFIASAMESLKDIGFDADDLCHEGITVWRHNFYGTLWEYRLVESILD